MSSVRKWNYKSKVSHQSTNSFYIIFLSSSASSIYDQFMKLVKWVYTLFNLGALKYWEADISAILTETDRLNIFPFQRPGCGNDVSYAVSIIRFKLFSSQSEFNLVLTKVQLAAGCQGGTKGQDGPALHFKLRNQGLLNGVSGVVAVKKLLIPVYKTIHTYKHILFILPGESRA